MRAAFFFALALAAIAADAILAVQLFADGFSEPAELGQNTLDPTRVFYHLAAAAIGAISLAALVYAPTFRDRAASALLFFTLALPLPGVGLSVAGLFTLVISLTKRQKDSESLFRVGSPLGDPISQSVSQPGDLSAAHTAQPLNSRIRSGDLDDLRTLVIGLRGLPYNRTAPVLERLQRDPDTYLQLYAQGDAAESSETEESLLRSLSHRVESNPDDHGLLQSFAAHLLHLASASTVAHDQRNQFLGQAFDLIRDLDSPRAYALRTAIHIRKNQPDAAASAFEKLVASDPQSQFVSKIETARLRAELLHSNRNWPQLITLLNTPEIEAHTDFAQVQKFFNDSSRTIADVR